MIGAIIGDIVGSPYEGSYVNWVDDKNFPLFDEKNSKFTDDTVLTCATADAILDVNLGKTAYPPDFRTKFIEWSNRYPDRGYGSAYSVWVGQGGIIKNKSYANGAMMRCSPIGTFWTTFAIAMKMAEKSIEWTHNSPESLRGVQSIVSAIHMAKNGKTKIEIKAFVEEQFGHMCDMDLDELRNKHTRNIRCNLSAPRALTCFFESTSFEDAIRNAVYIKGDTDTHAAIAGSIAESFYGVNSIPKEMINEAKKRLPLEMINLVNEFYDRVGKIYIKNPERGFQI